ncbi:MAG: hypothetical protein CMJ83_21210 [Planctomycetes bacterium]|nr:hypothetical protein [Planctomycetota bacterium]
MKIRVLLPLLAALAGAMNAQSGDIHEARRAFKAAVKAKSERERLAGVEALVACGDARGLDDLVVALLKVRKDLDKLESRIVKTGKKTGQAFKNVDKQGDAGRPVSVGSYNSAAKKAQKALKELQKLHRLKDALESWRAALLSGGGRLLDSIPKGDSAKAIHDQVSKLERAREHTEKILRLHLIAASKSDGAREALLGLAAREEDGEVRTAVIDAMGSRRDPRDVGALARALEDGVWPVRVTAARALGGIQSLTTIPPLIAALERGDGRFLEEVIAALEGHAGITFHDNATLWKAWWKDQGASLASILDGLTSDDQFERLRAIQAVGEKAFLLGARRLLDEAGLDPNSDENAKDAEPKGEPDADARAVMAASGEAVGRVLSTVAHHSRDQQLNDLLIRPMEKEAKVARRAKFIPFIGHVRTKHARSILIALAGAAPIRNPAGGQPYDKDDRAKLTLAAVKAIGGQGHPEVVPPLREALTGFESSEELRLAAAASLLALRLSDSVGPLITGLNNKGKVHTACQEALVDLTGENFGDYPSWRDWWTKNRKGFKPRRARAVAKDDKPQEERGGTRFYGINSRSKHVVFILDRSGSMEEADAKGEGKKIDVAKAELKKAIISLPKGATFNIIFYNSAWDMWRKKMTVVDAASRKKAIKWVDSIEHRGFTNIFDPLERAFQLAGRGTHDKAYGVLLDTIFFLSDGLANRGRIIAPTEILKQIERMNQLKKVKIHTIGIGKNHDPRLMKGLADLTGGVYVAR